MTTHRSHTIRTVGATVAIVALPLLGCSAQQDPSIQAGAAPSSTPSTAATASTEASSSALNSTTAANLRATLDLPSTLILADPPAGATAKVSADQAFTQYQQAWPALYQEAEKARTSKPAVALVSLTDNGSGAVDDKGKVTPEFKDRLAYVVVYSNINTAGMPSGPFGGVHPPPNAVAKQMNEIFLIEADSGKAIATLTLPGK